MSNYKTTKYIILILFLNILIEISKWSSFIGNFNNSSQKNNKIMNTKILVLLITNLVLFHSHILAKYGKLV